MASPQFQFFFCTVLVLNACTGSLIYFTISFFVFYLWTFSLLNLYLKKKSTHSKKLLFCFSFKINYFYLLYALQFFLPSFLSAIYLYKWAAIFIFSWFMLNLNNCAQNFFLCWYNVYKLHLSTLYLVKHVSTLSIILFYCLV